MGSHYAPPFAIIYMHSIETKALSILFSEFQYLKSREILYKRYIDDCIFGPFKRNDVNLNRILDIFNSVDEDIKFTLEVPCNGRLNFLNLTIWILSLIHI